ncbi:MAG: hypothetical protein WDN28_03415 [Chthoniobacter sp.]
MGDRREQIPSRFRDERQTRRDRLREPAETTDNLDGFIHDDWQKLRTAALEQFGPPAKTVAYPDAKSLHRGGWTVTDTWDRPGSRIKLGVTRRQRQVHRHPADQRPRARAE